MFYRAGAISRLLAAARRRRADFSTPHWLISPQCRRVITSAFHVRPYL
jgi:hypothetical protein